MDRDPGETPNRVSFKRASTWIVLCLAAAFLCLGILFVFASRWGVALFGIPAPEGLGRAYVQAIGFRDVALALYIMALVLFPPGGAYRGTSPRRSWAGTRQTTWRSPAAQRPRAPEIERYHTDPGLR
jgi:hypothetical protein